MPNSSWFFRSSLASAYFKPTQDGQIFTCPSPWMMFGRPREYRLTDEQAQELVSRLGRAYGISMVGMVVALIAAVAAAFALLALTIPNPTNLLADHPVLYVAVFAVIMLFLAGLSIAYIYRVANSVLADVPWTPAQREPFSWGKDFKKLAAKFMVLPTWLLVILFGMFAIEVPFSAMKTAHILADGQWSIELLRPVFYLLFATVFGVALVSKLKAQRSAS